MRTGGLGGLTGPAAGGSVCETEAETVLCGAGVGSLLERLRKPPSLFPWRLRLALGTSVGRGTFIETDNQMNNEVAQIGHKLLLT